MPIDKAILDRLKINDQNLTRLDLSRQHLTVKDIQELVEALVTNTSLLYLDLYKNEWLLYQNYFMPAMKLIEKIRIGSRYHKKYDCPQTPYQRALKEPAIPQRRKDKLTEIYRTLDPFLLKKNIQLKLKRIVNYAK